MDKDDLTSAQTSIERTVRLCTVKINGQPSKSSKCYIMDKLFRNYYPNRLTDEELHARLIYATVMAMDAQLELLTNCYQLTSLTCILFKVSRSIYQFRQCRSLYKTRKPFAWISPRSRSHYESGLRLERAVRQLFTSQLPTKLLKTFKLIDSKYGLLPELALRDLQKLVSDKSIGGIYQLMAEFVILWYWLYSRRHNTGAISMDRFFGGDKHIHNFLIEFLDKKLLQFPNSFIYGLAKTKLIYWESVDKAIGAYELLVVVNNHSQWPTNGLMYHKFAYWELMFAHAIKCEWYLCIRYAQLLRQSSTTTTTTTVHYSPAIAAYLEAVFRYTLAYDDNDSRLKQEATQLFR
ncbi:tetratricopeptide repeat protein 39B-like [Oppia nitens]|uniref:tetratricopeptide repeat protein 39B-like n=1 Tax=Oppia nitens TaxID=1686743 RepID=UPI0023DA95C1|nr:tetratricopeptide repeat protein 39B-like [Oppia nitens]